MFMFQLLSEGGGAPDTTLSWLLYVGGAVFLFVIVVGWWSSGRKQGQVEGRNDVPMPKSKKG